MNEFVLYSDEILKEFGCLRNQTRYASVSVGHGIARWTVLSVVV